jgi:serine/threonine protein kinase
MPDPNEPSLILDPRLGSLLVSTPGHLDATRSEAHGAPLPFGPPVAADEVGTLGSYRVVKELGRGGMGAVFLAVDMRLDRKLALKVMLPEFAADAESRERFVREARAAARIGHDNVVTVFEADERDGIPYIAMQLLQGYSLDEFVRKKGPPSLRHVARIAREAVLGLGAAHKLGVVHRDVKPANLWLEAPNGRVKLLDFGLARPDGLDTELTKSGVLLGTPAFMSPEQALGERVDHRTDLYSLGAVLYWLCTGQLPFPGSNVVAVLKALGSEEPKPVLELNPKIPEALAELIHRLLAKAPEERPQTAAEVANRLHEILDQSVGLSGVMPSSGTDPSGGPAGDTDPWVTIARPASAQAGGGAKPTGPGLLHSMPVVGITPRGRPGAAKPEESEEPEKPKKPAAGGLHTVISSGVVWKESENETEEQEEAEGRAERPRRKAKAEEEDEDEETEKPPRRRAKAEKEEEDEDEETEGRSERRRRTRAAGETDEERLNRLVRGSASAKGTGGGATLLYVGAGVMALAFFVVAAVLLAGGSKGTNSAQPAPSDPRAEASNRGKEPTPTPGPAAPSVPLRVTPDPAPPAAPPAVPAEVVPTAGARDKVPTILGEIARDPKFKTVGPAGGLLVGLETRFEKFGERVIARAVRPIYRVGGRDEYGQQFGNDLSGAVMLRARDEYAVGGIVGKAEQWCHGFALIYMRVKPDGTLDPRDSYQSEWAGYDGPCTVHRVVGDGTPVIGIVGKIVGPKTTALGLLFKGQEAWDPAGKPASTTKYGATEVVLGTKNDRPFRDEAPPGGLLVGFDVWYGSFAGYDVLDGIRPIYRTREGDSLGALHGRETTRGVRTLAKADYAVGGLIMKAGLGADSFVVVYMKVKGDRLDPDDSYQSEKFGGPGGSSHPMLGGDGTFVTGIIGSTDKTPKLNGLGLAFPKK